MDDSSKKTTYLNYLNFYALLTLNRWEQLSLEIANAIQTTSYVECQPVLRQILFMIKNYYQWQFTIPCEMSWWPQTSSYCRQVCTLPLPPSQLAINGHCLQFQQEDQGPSKLSDGSAILNLEVAFSKKIALSCQGYFDKRLVEILSNLSFFHWTREHHFKSQWIWLLCQNSVCFISPRNYKIHLPMGIPKSRAFWTDVFVVWGLSGSIS